jgi:hypothetical protein
LLLHDQQTAQRISVPYTLVVSATTTRSLLAELAEKGERTGVKRRAVFRRLK